MYRSSPVSGHDIWPDRNRNIFSRPCHSVSSRLPGAPVQVTVRCKSIMLKTSLNSSMLSYVKCLSLKTPVCVCLDLHKSQFTRDAESLIHKCVDI